MNVPKRPNIFKRRLVDSPFFKTAVGYLVITVAGLSAFYLVKRDITNNRVKNMQIREEILKSSKSDHYLRESSRSE